MDEGLKRRRRRTMWKQRYRSIKLVLRWRQYTHGMRLQVANGRVQMVWRRAKSKNKQAQRGRRNEFFLPICHVCTRVPAGKHSSAHIHFLSNCISRDPISHTAYQSTHPPPPPPISFPQSFILAIRFQSLHHDISSVCLYHFIVLYGITDSVITSNQIIRHSLTSVECQTRV